MSERPILDGLRVLDLSDGLAGSVASMLLAECGADVVKVEPPSAMQGRELPAFRTWNRSKRSVVLDLDTADGRAKLDTLLAAADVMVHQMVPSRAKTLGLDDESLRTSHPRLIVSSILAWPVNHPNAELPVDDLLTTARLGICDEQMPISREDGPTYVRVPLGSWCASWLAAIGIAARLLYRQRTGLAGPAHTSLVQGVLVPMAMHWHRAENPSPPLAFGMPKKLRGSQATLFECSDGQWVHTMPPGPGGLPLMKALMAEMGPERVAAENAANPSPPGMTSSPDDGAHRAAFKLRTSQEWLDELWANDVPAQLAAPFGAVLADEQARSNRYVIDIDDPDEGRITVPGHPMTIVPAMRVARLAPRLGEHTDEVLAEWAAVAQAMPPEPAAIAAPSPYPLSGLRVLDLGNFLAGPYGPQVFADLGAEVIKLEAATGDPMRPGAWPFAGCQRNKRGIALDLKSPQARPILEEIVRWADVVHHNLRLPAARRLGLDSDALRAIKEDLVFCHVSSYGPDGPRKDWPGYDQLFQAQCGWEVLGAGEGNPPMWHRFGFMDHLCALSSALATLLAVYEQRATGRTQDVAASLLGAGAMTNSETYRRADGSLAAFRTLNADQTCTTPGQRIMETADGWVAVSATTDAQRAQLARVCGATELGGAPAAVATRSSGELLAALEEAGVPCAPVALEQRDRFFDDATNKASRLAVTYTHAEWGSFEQPGALWDFGQDLSVRLELAPPALGEHTVEILRDVAGFGDEDVDRLVASGVATAFVKP